MKRAILLFFILFLNIISSQSSWQSEDELDEFGDPTGKQIQVYTGSGEWDNGTDSGNFDYKLIKKRSDVLEVYIFMDNDKVIFHTGQSEEHMQELLGALNDINYGAIIVKHPDGKKQTLTGQAMYLWDPTVFVPISGKMRKLAKKSPNSVIEVAIKSKFFGAGDNTYLLEFPVSWN